MKYHLLLLGVILFIAAFFRMYNLGSIPTGFFNDEAAVGYNAYSIIKTGKDEFGRVMPFFFESFGEGKLPLYIYQAAPTVWLLGLNEFAVRLPMALFGLLTVVLVWWWVIQLKTQNLKVKSEWVAVAAAGMLAIMPWHIHFSRGVFGQESLFWVLLGTCLYWVWILRKQRWWMVGAMIAWLASMLTYHSSRVFLPLWLGFLFVYHWKKTSFFQKITYFLLGLLLLALPWVYITVSPLGGARAAGVSVLHEASGVQIGLQNDILESPNQPLWYVRLLHNKGESFVRDIGARYVSHFDPQFLFFSGDYVRPRYRVPNVGQMFWFFLPFVVVGLFLLAKKKQWPVLVWLLIAPIPAALSFETPSTVRALFMVVPLAIAGGLGVVRVGEFLNLQFSIFNTKRKQVIQVAFILSSIIVVGYQLVYYYDAYFVHMQLRQPYYWQDGYKQLVQKVTALQDKYDRIEVTDRRGTPYIFFLFYNQYDPAKWHEQVMDAYEPAKAFNFIAIRQLDNFYFFDQTCVGEGEVEPDVLYVCTQENIPENLIEIDRINYNDGQPVFILLEKVSL